MKCPILNACATSVFGLMIAAAAVSAQDTTSVGEMHQVCGALLRDDFSGPSINTALWQPESFDEGVRVEIDDGELVIRGSGFPYTEEELWENPIRLQHCAGVWSDVYPQTDVALAVQVKIPSGIAEPPGSQVRSVHSLRMPIPRYCLANWNPRPRWRCLRKLHFIGALRIFLSGMTPEVGGLAWCRALPPGRKWARLLLKRETRKRPFTTFWLNTMHPHS